MKRLLGLLQALLAVLLVLPLAVLVWGLGSTAGARLLLEELAPAAVPGLSVRGVEGRLWGTLQVRELRYRDEGLDLALHEVELEGAWLRLLRRELAVRRLVVEDATLQLRPQPEEPPTPALTQLPVVLRIDRAELGALQLQPADGAAQHWSDLRLTASWRGERVTVERLAVTTPWVGRVQLDGIVALEPAAVRFEPLHLAGFVVARLEGRYAYDAASALVLGWRDLAWPPGGPATVASPRGSLHWDGQPEDYRYRLASTLQAGGLNGEIEAAGRGSLEQLAVERLQARLLGGTVDAQARLDWAEGLRVEAQGQARQLDPAKAWPEWPGRINGRFRAQTRGVGDPQVDFSLALQDSQLRGHPLVLDTRGRYGAEALELARLQLRSGRVRLQGEGRVWPDLAAQARLDGDDLSQLWPGLAGRLQARVVARGAYAAPRLQLDADGRELRYEELRLARLRLNGAVDWPARVDLDAELQGLQAGVELDSLRLGLHGPLAQQRLTLAVAGAPGRAELQFSGALDPVARGWQGQIDSGRLAPARFAAWQLEAPSALRLALPADAEPELSLAPACWASTRARACLRLLREPQHQRLAFRLEGFDLAYLQPLLPADVQLALPLDGDGQVDLDRRGLSGLRLDLRSGAGHWRQAGLPALELKPGRLQVGEQREGLRLDLALPLAQGGLSAQATLAPGADFRHRPLQGQVRLALPDLSWLRLLSPELTAASGRVEGALQLGGSLETPQLQGAATLADGRFRLATPGIELGEVRARLEGQGTAPLRLVAQASSGGGTLAVEGELQPWESPLRLDLTIKGENFQAARTPEARAWVSPDLRLQLAGQRLSLGGTLAVPRAEITLDTLDQGVAPSADQVIVGPEAAEQGTAAIGLEAQVGVLLGDQVRFEGFGLKTRLSGGLQVSQMPGVGTRGRGEIRLVEGRYKAYGQDLKIETGRLLFSGGPVTEPGLDLRATRSPREDIEVGVAVRGTLDQPQLSLFSTPSMPQQRQLSWLILGIDLDSGSAGTESNKALLADAALSMGLAGSEWLAQRFGGRLGLDQVTIGAKPGEATGQARLTIGKYLTPGLYVSYGIGLFQPGHVVQIEYAISRHLKLTTESGAETGGDLLYTIER